MKINTYILLVGIGGIVLGISVGVFLVSVFGPMAKKTTSIGSNKVSMAPASPTRKAYTADPAVLVWIPYWDEKRAVESLMANIEKVDFVSLFWYGIREDTTVEPYTGASLDDSLIARIQEHDIPVFMIVANIPDYTEGGDWDADRVGEVIGSRQAREEHIAELLALMDSHGFDGINIDYEALKSNQRDDFSAFIAELSEKLHLRGKLLSVAIHPKTGEGKPNERNGSQAQDIAHISRYADQIHIMTYEQHNTGTGPGPIASYTWVQEIMRYMAAQSVPGGAAIYTGIPLYGYNWYEDSDGDMHVEGLDHAEVVQLMEEHTPERLWSDRHKESYFYYEDDGDEHEVWYSDAESVRHLVDITRSEGLAGVAFWRIGGEDERIWDLF